MENEKIYAVALLATRNIFGLGNHRIEHFDTVIAVAPGQDALQIADLKCIEQFPPAEGWINHFAHLIEV